MADINNLPPNNLSPVPRRGRDLVQGVFSNGVVGKENGIDVLKDYRHAARIFVDGAYRLSPKYGFLFYVEFDFNPLISNVGGPAFAPGSASANGQAVNKTAQNSAQELGMIVKSVTLPKFTLEVKEHNAYNRKNFVQNRIKYDPVTINFHDDQADTVRNFWYDYYSFYYRDTDYADVTYNAFHKYQTRPALGWGYTPKINSGFTGTGSNQQYQYIQAIRIYSLYQHQFSECELINPIITSFRHGEHSNGDNTNLLSHEMSVQFETVKYLTGYVTTNTAGGFIDLHYDTTPSTIPFTGSTFQPNVAAQLNTVTDLNSFHPAPGANMSGSGFSAMYGASTFATPGGVSDSSNPAGGFAAGSAVSYGVAAQLANTNAGGITIPGYGSDTSLTPMQAQALTNNSGFGISFSATQYAQAGAQFQATGLSGFANQLENNAINQAQTAVLSGLGPSPINLAAAVKNPSQAAQLVKNMAIGYATSYVNQQVGSLISYGLSSVKQNIADGVGIAAGDINLSSAVTSLKTQFNDLFKEKTLPIDYSGQEYINNSVSNTSELANQTLDTTPTFSLGTGLNATATQGTAQALSGDASEITTQELNQQNIDLTSGIGLEQGPFGEGGLAAEI